MTCRDHKEMDNVMPKRCEFCGSEQGKLRPVGKYIVELKPIIYRNQKVLACSSCVQKLKLERKNNANVYEKFSKKESGIHLEKLAEILTRISERYRG